MPMATGVVPRPFYQSLPRRWESERIAEDEHGSDGQCNVAVGRSAAGSRLEAAVVAREEEGFARVGDRVGGDAAPRTRPGAVAGCVVVDSYRRSTSSSRHCRYDYPDASRSLPIACPFRALTVQ